MTRVFGTEPSVWEKNITMRSWD